MNSRFLLAKLPLALTRVRLSSLPVYTYKLNIKNERTGQVFSTEIDSGDTVLALKKQIERSLGIPLKNQKLGVPFTDNYTDNSCLDPRHELGKQLSKLYNSKQALSVEMQ